MIYHVLPGDAQVETFRETDIGGEVIVCRECLIDGDIGGETRDEFWQRRASFLSAADDGNAAKYLDEVAAELERLSSVTRQDEVNLWFEHELFCQVNYWFCISLARDTHAAIFRVAPSASGNGDRWNGFGRLSADDLKRCFEERVILSPEDIATGVALWDAYRSGDDERLRKLSEKPLEAFPHLADVCEAATVKNTRPLEIIAQIRNEGITDFKAAFSEFSQRAGVYGFGDSQVRKMWQNSEE